MPRVRRRPADPVAVPGLSPVPSRNGAPTGTYVPELFPVSTSRRDQNYLNPYFGSEIRVEGVREGAEVGERILG